MRTRKTKFVKESLKHASTYDLVQELIQREGVEMRKAGPYKNLQTNVNGAAIVLTIID